MRYLLILLLSAIGLQAQINPSNQMATVIFQMTNSLGFPDTNYFRVIPIQQPVLANGTVITRGVPFRMCPNTNGIAFTNLQVGWFQMTNSFLNQGMIFEVPNNTNTYYVTALARSGFNTYEMTGVLGLTSSDGSVGLTPINGTGFVNLSAQNTTNGSFTNINVTYLTNLYAYITNLYSTNVFTTNLYASTFITQNAYTTNLYGPFITNFLEYSTNLYVTTNIVNQQFVTNEQVNISYVTNQYVTMSIVTNLYVTTNYQNTTFVTNEYVNVSYITNLTAGKVTINNLFTGNQWFTTNAFPSATNTFDLTNSFQWINATTSVSITNLNSVSNNYVGLGMLLISNTSVGNITFTWNVANSVAIGAQTKPQLTIGSGKTAWCRILTWGNTFTNYADDLGDGTLQVGPLTGDIATSGSGSAATTLATVNSSPGTYGDGTHVAVVTVNGKGLATTVSSTAITGAAPTGSAGGVLSGNYPNPTFNYSTVTNGMAAAVTVSNQFRVDATHAFVASNATASAAAIFDAVNNLTNAANAHGVFTNSSTGPPSFGLLQNTELQNSSITIQGASVSLGGSTLAGGSSPAFNGINLTNQNFIVATNNGGGGALVAGSPGTALTCYLTNIAATTTLAAMTFWNSGLSVIQLYATASGGNQILKFPANFQGAGDLYGIDLNGTGDTVTNSEAKWYEIRCIYGVKTNVFHSSTK